jgi:hypothetical protein
MRFLKYAAVTVVAASLLMGQEKADPVKLPNSEAAIIPVKTLTGDAFNRLAKMLRVFNVRYEADEQLRTIVVYAPKDVVDQMRKVVEQLDRPGSEAAIGRNIDMTLAFLLCSTKANSAPSEIPADLEPVAKQLRAATPYKSISVLDVVPLRLQEGKDAEQNSQIAGLSENIQGPSTTARLVIRPQAIIRKDADRYVRFDYIRVFFRVPYTTSSFKGGENANALISTNYQFRDLTLGTSGDFKEGQKTVLGKISGISEDGALFVVVSVKILD